MTLGAFKLNASQVSRLGQSKRRTFEPSDNQVAQTSGKMQEFGYAEFQIRGDFLVSSNEDNNLVGEHVGQMRICFEYEECGNTTIIA